MSLSITGPDFLTSPKEATVQSTNLIAEDDDEDGDEEEGSTVTEKAVGRGCDDETPVEPVPVLASQNFLHGLPTC